ncbi:linear amide C-N hydrolase [Secundilactobacillus folii]|uniref:Linear amide C-N hydrolase n=1 Tax=Secundilactobacillus folii TaxID=2678357 RepID=A0A7X2XX46_9LACO|nr:linear amide C-N hydrolase [Secundilactobacillus folii]MTV83284.1 linear amide C-N hydrolase [Secundilactobacillus folii]
MCTSLTLAASDGAKILARTMDFPNVDPWQPTVIEPGTQWRPILDKQRLTHYRIVGSARHLDGHYLFGDGLNSAGLSCAELYFPNRTHYYDDPQPGKINLTPQDFILWVLSNHATIADVAADLDQIAMVGKVWYAENKIYPFHWLLADSTGQTAVLEPMSLTLTLTDDPVKVLTNTPELSNHIERLDKFLETDAKRLPAAATNYLASQKPLPEGPIPTNRFIRTAINRWGQPTAETATKATQQAVAILQEVVIPKTADKVQAKNHNFTHYISVIDMTNLRYTQIPIDNTPKKVIDL